MNIFLAMYLIMVILSAYKLVGVIKQPLHAELHKPEYDEAAMYYAMCGVVVVFSAILAFSGIFALIWASRKVKDVFGGEKC